MARIKGKFAPIMAELVFDERFAEKLTDIEKLLYLLIIYTAHMTNHKAPNNAVYYKRMYGLRTRKSNLTTALQHILYVYPKLQCNGESLSLLNSPTYKNQFPIEVKTEIEVEEEGKNKTRVARFTPPHLEEVRSYIADHALAVDPARWHDFYASKGWMVGKNKMKDWKAAVRTWHRSNQPQEKPKKERLLTEMYKNDI